MSRSRSASLEIVPPTSSRARNLADVMDAMFKSNNNTNKANDDDESKDFDDADAEADEIDDEPPVPKASAKDISNMPNAPIPCERCVRTGKPCKGVTGSRCEYCKRLKQKCSNSTGPARGKHAAAKKATNPSGAPKATGSKGTLSEVNNVKRKSPPRDGSAMNGDTHSLDGEGSIDYEEGHEPPPRLNKKRRISKGAAGPSRAQLVKAISDMEASVKRIQTSVSKEVDKMNSIISSLNVKIKEMGED